MSWTWSSGRRTHCCWRWCNMVPGRIVCVNALGLGMLMPLCCQQGPPHFVCMQHGWHFQQWHLMFTASVFFVVCPSTWQARRGPGVVGLFATSANMVIGISAMALKCYSVSCIGLVVTRAVGHKWTWQMPSGGEVKDAVGDALFVPGRGGPQVCIKSGIAYKW